MYVIYNMDSDLNTHIITENLLRDVLLSKSVGKGSFGQVYKYYISERGYYALKIIKLQELLMM